MTDGAPRVTDGAPRMTDDAPRKTDDAPRKTDGAPRRTDETPRKTDAIPPVIDDAPSKRPDHRPKPTITQELTSGEGTMVNDSGLMNGRTRMGASTGGGLLLLVLVGGCARPATDSVNDFRDVHTITQPAQLAALATQSPNVGIRSAAISRVEDPAVLAQVAAEDELWQLRLAAASALPDQTQMAEIAAADKAWQVRVAAVAHVTDQEVLTAMATTDDSWQVRAAAVALVNDKAVLFEVAREDRSGEVRNAAVAGVTDQNQLARLLTLDGWDAKGGIGAGSTAIDKLTDPELLAHVAMNGTDGNVRSSATSRVTDPAVLVEVALAHGRNKHDEEPDVICGTSSRGPREAPAIATNMIDDQRTLMQIATQSGCSAARLYAIARVVDEATLRTIAANGQERSYNRDAATRRLETLKPRQ